MHRWTALDQVPESVGPSVVTIGNFDGVHRGHRSVLTAMVADARALDGWAVAVTFDPHPAVVHRPDQAPPMLTGLDARLDLLEETGLDGVLVLPYSLDFARTSPEDFVRRYLVQGLRAAVVVVGRDVRFGRDNAGDLGAMLALGRQHGFEVQVIEDVHGPRPGAAPRRWSSTWARELLAAGDVVGAAEILGRWHSVGGTVVHGDARGRTLGFPTANLGADVAGMIPADGVYAGWMRRSTRPDALLPVAISVGTNPTFDGHGRRVEAHVLDRDDLELYGERVVLDLVARLRPTVRYDSVDALVAQMHHDVEQTRVALAPDPVG